MEMEQRVARLEKQARTHRLVMAAQAAALAAMAVAPMALAGGKGKVARFDEVVVGDPTKGESVTISPDGIVVGSDEKLLQVEAGGLTIGGRKANRMAVRLVYDDPAYTSALVIERPAATVVFGGGQLAGFSLTTTQMAGGKTKAIGLGYGTIGAADAEPPGLRFEVNTGAGPKSLLVP